MAKSKIQQIIEAYRRIDNFEHDKSDGYVIQATADVCNVTYGEVVGALATVYGQKNTPAAE